MTLKGAQGPEDHAGAGIALISRLNQSAWGHGTAVRGDIVAVDDTLGGVGIAPRAHPGAEWRAAPRRSWEG